MRKMIFYHITKCQLQIFLIMLSRWFVMTNSKWVEGHLKTSQNWAFLSRFCFLSHEGQFEYQIEFNREIGIPNLLLYYDDESQWPSVYHSNKTCTERENVLNKAGQNQIIPLSPWYPENEFSGCVMKQVDLDASQNSGSQKPSKNKAVKNITKKFKTQTNISGSTQDPRYYDQFLINLETEANTMPNYNSTSDDTAEITSYPTETIENQFEILEGFMVTESGLPGVNKNDTDIISNLMDVETLFNSSDKNGQSHIIKRQAGRYTDKNKIKKFNSDPPRPSDLNLSTNSNKRIRVTVACHNMRRFRSVRERWWFIAISNCGDKKDLDVKYKFLMTNGPPGDYWHEHFSADEFYILPILMAFCFAYVLMIMAIVMCSVELKTRQMLHTTYKLFVLSVSFQQSGILFQSLSYGNYAVSGVGGTNTKVFGQLLCGISEISYLLLLILMAKGYTITRARLKVAFTVKLTVFICCYSITYTALFIFQAKEFDPGEVLYLYESPPGYGLIVLRICAWFMFIYAIIFTMKKYPEKDVFYFPFSLCGTLWFYAGPLFILTANNYIDKWVRESVVIAVLMFITFCGHITFLLLTLPVFANKNFPYHVRTTQIGVMEVTGMIAGNSTMDHFSHNIYTTSAHNIGIPQSVIIPLTRRTEELIGGPHSYIASAPPLNALSPYHGRISNLSTVNHISGNIPEQFTINNIGPKLSVSTQHSTESDNKQNNYDENCLNSLENRFVPNDIIEAKQNDENHLDTNHNDNLSQNSGSRILSIEQDLNVNEDSYKNDPNYIKDINNPFLIGASIRQRNGLLEPIKRDTYNLPPPIWSLAKSRNAAKNKKNSENVKKTSKDYNLQGVVGTFPLPQIHRRETKIKNDDIIIKETDSEIKDDESLQILYHAGEKLDDTTLALFSTPKNEST